MTVGNALFNLSPTYLVMVTLVRMVGALWEFMAVTVSVTFVTHHFLAVSDWTEMDLTNGHVCKAKSDFTE